MIYVPEEPDNLLTRARISEQAEAQMKNDGTTFDDNRTGKGTKEWSDFSYNICLGCEHECLYCYAKAQRSRFDEGMRQPGVWKRQRLNPTRRALGAEVGAKGVVMFPTTQDITPRFLKRSLKTIKNLLANNQVLIVSKPHLSVVRALCKELADRKGDILFRFTIGSLKKSSCAFWEPGAPPPRERISALKHAFDRGFSTSVSIEPMLEGREEICKLVAEVEPFVTDTVWVGKMQRIPRKQNAHVKGFAEAVTKIKAQQTDSEILELVKALKGHSKVRWKDSIKAVLKKSGTGVLAAP
jgi:DNA repair photolyase